MDGKEACSRYSTAWNTRIQILLGVGLLGTLAYFALVERNTRDQQDQHAAAINNVAGDRGPVLVEGAR